MKQSLNLRLSQHLALTPQLQQSIRLLQLSTVELQQEIEQMLEANPFLEPDESTTEAAEAAPADAPAPVATADENGAARDDTAPPAPSGGDAVEIATPASDAADDGAELRLDQAEADWSGDADAWDDARGESWQGSGSGDADDDFDPLGLAHVAPGLREHLRTQLAGLALSLTERAAAEAIIDSLDDDGYLPEGPDQLAAELAAQADDAEREALAEALRVALKLVQSFDPAGVGAADLAGCMTLQLLRLPASPARELSLALCAGGHLELLSKRDWKRLGRALGADEPALRCAQQLIARLDPRPGARFGGTPAQSIVPDVIAQRSGKRWRAVLNPEVLPRLRINGLYAELLRRSREGGGMSGQLQEARWFVRNVQQRFETIERVAQAVVERQQNFFSHGELGMRPLVLREIADELGLHESTISRVTTQKFMLTPHGTFELKYFFGSGLATDTGGNASSTAVRAIIRQMVHDEAPSAPLSDGEIAERLAAQGISVARRTVAKYREALRIPPATQRKSV
ncbi:RNA polymerase sigma-54 factor [mine drainage metagenome]|uniref:RNA polymerase sigma-54 factor n=1 Tax=mine drainage metagenome TaxID=410659 RepID=A0A1J5QY06_9ZZZZ